MRMAKVPMKTFIPGLALIAAMGGAGCQSKPAHSETEVVGETSHPTITQQVAAATNNHIVSTVTFGKDKQGVSPEASAELDRAISEALKRGQIESIEIAAWSDMGYPGDGKTLPKHQVDLAKNRAMNIKRYMDRKDSSASTTTHNMAEHASTLGEWFRTDDADLKTELADAGLAESPSEAGEGGRTSSALILIRLK